MHLEQLAYDVIGAALRVHTALGYGLLINFNVKHLRDGIQRVVFGHPESGIPAANGPHK